MENGTFNCLHRIITNSTITNSTADVCTNEIKTMIAFSFMIAVGKMLCARRKIFIERVDYWQYECFNKRMITEEP